MQIGTHDQPINTYIVKFHDKGQRRDGAVGIGLTRNPPVKTLLLSTGWFQERSRVRFFFV